MKINQDKEGSKLTISLEGRLDTTTAPELDKVVQSSLAGITELIFQFEALEYISSAGLRVLLTAQKTMNKQGNMEVRGANEALQEIFDVTGFSDILNIV